MRAGSLARGGPLEEEMAPHPSILAWEIPWTEEPGGLQSMGHTESHVPGQLSTHTARFTDRKLIPEGL